MPGTSGVGSDPEATVRLEHSVTPAIALHHPQPRTIPTVR